ncbi:MAG: nucleotidyltransferase domain-containing protein [Parachlamydiaceae bacterium]
MQYENVIKSKICELENTHDIRILFACESGSRAWGFPSPDSDYDARFIYVHSQDWYLSIHERRDVVELPVDKMLDINGWDLRKVLRLVQKHNAAIYEWIQSPIVYAANDVFVKKFWEVAAAYFSPKATMHHYLSSAKKYYEECVVDDMIKLKKLLYCIRVVLAGLWVAQHKTIPPMELDQLLKITEDQSVVVKVRELVDLKKLNNESYQHPREYALELFLKEGITHCENVSHSLPVSSQYDDAMLNAFFRTMFSA